MSFVLRAQNPGGPNTSPYEVAMSGDRLSVGRGMENDLVLPDPDRMLSKRHCIVEQRDGGYVLTDLSTNGTYLNYAAERLDDVPTPLSNGDVILVGPFELIVEIGAHAVAPSQPSNELLPPLETMAPQDLPPPMPTPAPESAAPMGDFLDDLLGGPAPAPVPSDPGSQPNHSPAEQDQFAPPRPNVSLIPDDWAESFVDRDQAGAPVASAVTEGPTIPPLVEGQAAPQSDAVLRAFLEGVGAAHLQIPEAEVEETMARMGRVMGAMIKGMREVLLARAALKSEMRMARTMINTAGNNPLKFSISAEQAVEAMIRPSVPGYLEAESAVTEALDDVKAHEVATMTGMEAALRDLLDRLGPEKLSARMDASGASRGFLGNKKARYWEAYEQHYSDIARETEESFQASFGKAFARAYEDQIRKL